MPYDPDVHHRRSIRLPEYDYPQDGMYFVTICTYQRECVLGEVVNGLVRLSPAGEAVQATWDSLPQRFPSIALDWSVVMPNHLHGVLFLGADPAYFNSNAPSLGSMVRAFKSLSAIAANRLLDRAGAPFWQRNYHEHVVRNDADLARIRAYIDANPANWEQDEENPARANS